MNASLQRRLKAFAENFKGPLGPIPLDRAVRRHRGLFAEFRDEGFTWSQIARALLPSAYGVPMGVLSRPIVCAVRYPDRRR
jgi:hypothetical protein